MLETYPSSPATANICVERQAMIVEVLADVAVRRRQECLRRTPAVRIGLAFQDVVWNFAASEVPHLDALAVPQMREDSSTSVVKARSEGTLVGVGHATASVVVVSALAHGVDECAEEIVAARRLRHVASFPCV